MDAPCEEDPKTEELVRELLGRMADRWSLLTMEVLADGELRFSQLRERLPGISQKMLTSTLRDLERDGFVSRTVTPTIPPRVDYELTELGMDLRGPLAAISEWALRNRERVIAAREKFAEENPDARPGRVGRVALIEAPRQR